MDSNYIEHVVEHYLARDRWRAAMIEYLSRSGGRMAQYEHKIPTPSHLRNADMDFRYANYSVDKNAVHKTRESLKRSKEATVEYLHELLHKVEVLSDDQHFHQGGDIFHFLIHEMEDVPDLGDLL